MKALINNNQVYLLNNHIVSLENEPESKKIVTYNNLPISGSAGIIEAGKFTLKPGLYDANDTLLATYADSGLIADARYNNIAYKREPGSGYSTMQRYPACTKVILPNTITKIGDYAFFNCSRLASITIPDSVTSIDGYALMYCSSLTSVTIGNSVASIGYKAFSRCSSLTSITIPDSVTSIGAYAFSDCSSLQYNIYDNAKYLGNSNNPYVALINATSTSITSCNINENTKVIAEYAFIACRKLTSITIPDSVTSISSSAFESCDSLTSVTIPDSVTSIGQYAFYGCSSLTSITIGNSVASIGDHAFDGCSSLTNTTFRGTPSTISTTAFSYCSQLSDIYVPWSYGAVAGAPWGATNATIHYNTQPN